MHILTILIRNQLVVISQSVICQYAAIPIGPIQMHNLYIAGKSRLCIEWDCFSSDDESDFEEGQNSD